MHPCPKQRWGGQAAWCYGSSAWPCLQLVPQGSSRDCRNHDKHDKAFMQCCSSTLVPRSIPKEAGKAALVQSSARPATKAQAIVQFPEP